jgi:antitoxin (DNA-binding transcriptional repressor) of toxin-antitoxin stability system
MKASIVDLRYHMKHVLKAIDRGETVTVYYRGKEKAKLVPIKGARKAGANLAAHPAFGIWKDHEDLKDPLHWVRKLREGRKFDF